MASRNEMILYLYDFAIAIIQGIIIIIYGFDRDYEIMYQQ
jgi:hypothetical protein